jgi:hypothetical protein
MNIKDLDSDNKKVKFKFYRKGYMYYETDTGFQYQQTIAAMRHS